MIFIYMKMIQNPAWKVASTALTCSNITLTLDVGSWQNGGEEGWG